ERQRPRPIHRGGLPGRGLDHLALPPPADSAGRACGPISADACGGGQRRVSTRRAAIVVYILAIWFVISFVTNIIGPLMPTIIGDFGLNLALAGFLPFSFFLAYGIVSIPAGIVVEKYGAKR